MRAIILVVLVGLAAGCAAPAAPIKSANPWEDSITASQKLEAADQIPLDAPLSTLKTTFPEYDFKNAPENYYPSASAPQQDICSIISGASIVADDGAFLGKITNSYDSKSVLNEYGTHGNDYNPDSIWNTYGQYGNEYSAYSPFNSYSNSPPMIIKNGNVIGYLTTNNHKVGAIHPYTIKTCELY